MKVVSLRAHQVRRWVGGEITFELLYCDGSTGMWAICYRDDSTDYASVSDLRDRSELVVDVNHDTAVESSLEERIEQTAREIYIRAASEGRSGLTDEACFVFAEHFEKMAAARRSK